MKQERTSGDLAKDSIQRKGIYGYRLAKKLVGETIAQIILTEYVQDQSDNNPTGQRLTAEEIKQFVEFAVRLYGGGA